ALGGEYIVVGPDAAPEAGGDDFRFLTHELDPEIGDRVGNVGRAIDAVDVDVLLIGGREPACEHRRAGDAIGPAVDLAVLEAGGDHVAIDRTIDIVPDVFLARPDDFEREVYLLREPCRDHRHVRLEPAAEAAAEQVLMHGDFFRRQVQ